MTSKIIPLPSVLLIWKVRKGREKLQKPEYLENEKSFTDEIKNIFLKGYRMVKKQKFDKK